MVFPDQYESKWLTSLSKIWWLVIDGYFDQYHIALPKNIPILLRSITNRRQIDITTYLIRKIKADTSLYVYLPTKCINSCHFQKIWHFWELEAQILPLCSSESLKILQKYQFWSPWFLVRNTNTCSWDPTFTAIYPLTSPQIWKSGLHIPTRKKNWMPFLLPSPG